MKQIHELIADYAAETPHKTALQDPYGEISYEELEAKSTATSCKLTGLGVKQGNAVAVYVPFVKEIMLGAIAAFRTGCIFVPFDGAYPEKRLEYMLEDAEAAAILTTREFWESKKLYFPEDRVLFLDEVEPTHETSNLKPQTSNLSESSPAMLLYTSGTTGKPKGVLHSHRMLLHIADCAKLHPDAEMNANTRSGIMSSFPFVATMMFLIGPLLHGGTVCIAPEVARKDMGFLYQFIQEARVTHIFLPSGLAAIMAEDYDLKGVSVFAAGEKLRNFRPCSPDNMLINLYGSTEVCPIISKKIHGNEERILVGKPYQNTKTRIVDDGLQPVGSGVAGELIVSNDYMSSGYHKLPELSAEKWFMLDGERWFHTGDRAVCTADGDIDILGRTDNMVKLSGFRIETGEVEAQITKAISQLTHHPSPDVGQVVVVVKNINGIDHLSCYYEAKRELDRRAVTAEIANYLAEYMIPDVWERMDALPRNLNGKVMRNELPSPKRERNMTGVIDSEVLFRVLMTAEDVLAADTHIGPDERFTDVGGTSLIAMKYAVALREQGIKITGKQILQYNTFRKIADVADVAYEQLWSREEYESVVRDFATRGEHIEKVLPIANWQNEMLFRQLISPDSHSYRNVVFLQVDSIISEAHLREALDIVARENEQLRSAIVFHGIPVIQQVITDRKIPLEMVEAPVYDSHTLGRVRDALYNAPIDLQFCSMMKIVCLHAKQHSFLYVLTHHIAVSQQQLRQYLLRLMQVLANHYPNDVSISDWMKMLEFGMQEDQPTKPQTSNFKLQTSQKEICVYSSLATGPKMVFVHTANTGSDAYYQLADRIGDRVSFAVIEPYNLYHPDDVRHGIKAIASNYIRILKEYQPEGPYILGGWCYGGVVAHEMACQLRASGEDVKHLIMLDSHALGDNTLREMSKGMLSEINVAYFEMCPLFAELREAGMLEAMVRNAANVAEDLTHHSPSFFDGHVTYFKPNQMPAGVTGDNRRYWEKMMEFEAGNYENYCNKQKLHIVHTPHEHDLMMDDASLEIIVPELLRC